jgi:hypothetical protein
MAIEGSSIRITNFAGHILNWIRNLPMRVHQYNLSRWFFQLFYLRIDIKATGQSNQFESKSAWPIIASAVFCYSKRNVKFVLAASASSKLLRFSGQGQRSDGWFGRLASTLRHGCVGGRGSAATCCFTDTLALTHSPSCFIDNNFSLLTYLHWSAAPTAHR